MKKNLLKRIPVSTFLFIGYALIILIGSILLFMPFASADGESHAYIDCLFTSVSATCVTGLVPFNTGLEWSTFGQIVIMMLIQVGGLGFMTVITLFYLLFGKRIGVHDQNILMHSHGSFSVGDIIPLIRKILIMTFAVEANGALILFLSFYGTHGMKGLYYAIFTSISAFCNAGFDVFGGNSMTGFASNPVVLITVSALIIAGGLGFVVWSDIFKNKFNLKKCQLHTNVVLIVNAILIFGGALLFFILEFTDVGVKGNFSDMPLGDKIVNSIFMSVSPRTAGFNSVDLTQVSGPGQFLTIILMFIGGNSCSTAGGIKVTTAVVVLANLVASAKNKKEVKLMNRRVSNEVVKQASAVLISYMLLTVSAVLLMGIFEPFGLNEILFEVVSAVATVGLSLDVTPHLSVISKVIVILLMYVGRLGAFTLFELLFSRSKKEYISRPEGKIMVG